MSLEITSLSTELSDVLHGIEMVNSTRVGPFQVLSDAEVIAITNQQYQAKKPQVRKRYTIQQKNLCECGGRLTIQDSQSTCENCGITESAEDIDASTLGMSNYNTSSESANPLRITGPGGSIMQRKLICKTSDYDKTRLRDTMQQMIAAADSYKACTIPQVIVKEAGQCYYDLQKVCEIKRGDVRRGAMATCLRLICEKHGLHKRRIIFAEMFKISSSDLSEGEKLLERLFSDGKLNRDDFLVKNQENSRIQGYLIQSFIKLNIPLPPDLTLGALGSEIKPKVPYNPDKPYYEFVKRLVEFTYHFRLAESSTLPSKCVGSIWIMAARCPELGLTQEQLVTECEISRSTFKRFSTVIDTLLQKPTQKEERLQKKLKHLFHKHNINLVVS
jgi:hypothetical protein